MMAPDEQARIEDASTAMNALLAAAIGEEWRKRVALREAMDRAISAHATDRPRARGTKRRTRGRR